MKGPSGRLKFDVRRCWLCPRCQRKDLISGQVVHRICPSCQIGMTLVEEKQIRREPSSTPASEAQPAGGN